MKTIEKIEKIIWCLWIVIICYKLTEILITKAKAETVNVLDKYEAINGFKPIAPDTIINWKDSFDTTYIDEINGCRVFTNK